MGLYRRNDSTTWWMSFSVDGRSYRRATGTTDKKLADAILAKVKTQIIEGKWFDKEEQIPECLFLDLAAKYEEWMQGRYRSDMKVHIIRQLKERFQDYSLSMIDNHELEKLQSEKLRAGRYRKRSRES